MKREGVNNVQCRVFAQAMRNQEPAIKPAAREEQTKQMGWNATRLWNLGLNVGHGISGTHWNDEGLTREGSHENVETAKGGVHGHWSSPNHEANDNNDAK